MSSDKMLLMRSLLIIGFILLAIACKKDKEVTFSEGVYQGTFQRQTTAGGPLVSVSLTFSNGQFSGQSNSPERYPVIGKGSYTATGDAITFRDSLYYTADFDWSLILAENYAYYTKGDSLIILRQYPGIQFMKDVYRLKKHQ